MVEVVEVAAMAPQDTKAPHGTETPGMGARACRRGEVSHKVGPEDKLEMVCHTVDAEDKLEWACHMVDPEDKLARACRMADPEYNLEGASRKGVRGENHHWAGPVQGKFLRERHRGEDKRNHPGPACV